MVKKMGAYAYWKDIFREVKKTMGRFISLLIISALGASAVVGIQATSIDMRAAADKMYKEKNLYDIHLKSTIGFEDSDIDALQNSAGVHTVMPAYIYDAFIYFEHEARTVRTYSLPDTLNEINLLDGRLPQNTGECVVDQDLLIYGKYEIGDSITLGLDNMDDYYDIFDENIFTVVGVIFSPFYISLNRGNTVLGDGRLNFYLYLYPETYKFDVYTDIYILMDGSQDMDNLTDDYYDFADEWKRQIELIGDVQVQHKKDEFDDIQKEIDDGWIEFHDGKEELNEKITETRKELGEALMKLNEIRNQLEEMENIFGKAAVADNWNEYYKGMDEYNDAWVTLESEIDDAINKLEEIRIELVEAQEKLDGAPVPEWFYFTRKDGLAYDSYYQDTLRLQKIGYVFPLVFFFVAILVSLTTMSRMVEEHRTQIGIYKALGYRSGKIIMKYLIYAFTAGVTGGVFGVIAGSNIFPRVISDAYGHLYEMPPVETPVPPGLSFLAVALSVGIVLLVTLATCIGSMSDTPAGLMRPKSPPDGKRVLIEKIPFIWSRLSFIGKVTARNIFRYKKRFVMTLIGVAGCSALLITAFGLRDSVSGVGDLQYEKIIKYSSKAYLKEIKTPEQRNGLDLLLSGLPGESLYVREESIEIKNNGGNFAASLAIPETPEKFNDFIDLRSHKTDEIIYLDSGWVLLTEKMAREINVSIGGSVEIITGDNKAYTVKVSGVVENYILHYVYMPPDLYEELTGIKPLYNGILAFGDNETEFAETLLTDDNVRAVVNTEDIKSNISESTDALQIVALVLIILACMLALVVLFNLTNINITERIRELATIKVLGFYDSELAMYIYRENFLVTAMGITLGIACGIWLHGFVLKSAEIDLIIFPHIIKPLSYIYAVALSVVFAVFVNLVMNYRLLRIDMVESLKNVE